MLITSRFQLSMSPEEAWELLTDLERVAPCMPGVEVNGVEGEELHGTMRVKVGPITTSYNTSVRIAERDEGARRAVLSASGRETRGQGSADATVTATLAAAGGGTQVDLETDLAVAGRVAQFGRGALTEVANRLLEQFAERLEREGLAAARSTPEALDPGGALAATRIATAIRGLAAVASVVLLWALLRRH